MSSAASSSRSNAKRSHSQSAAADFLDSGDDFGCGPPAGGRKGKGSRAKQDKLAVDTSAPHPADVSVVHNALLCGAPVVNDARQAGGAAQEAAEPEAAPAGNGNGNGVYHMSNQQMLANQLAVNQAQAMLAAMPAGDMSNSASVPYASVPISTLAFLAARGSFGDPGNKRIKPDSAKHHAEVEKDRRNKLNGAIESLRTFFPETLGPKHLVVERAVSYIADLQQELHTLRSTSDSSSNSTGSRNQSKDDQEVSFLEAERLDASSPTM